MKVSVIIPNYNHAQFLQRRIESILAQSYNNFEIIILDDHSTDNSRDLIEKYRANPKVYNIIYNESNGGSVFKQWLKGIQLARTELVWIAESDDRCEPNFLEVLVNGIKENPSCVVAFAQSYCVNDDNEVRWQSNHPKTECVSGKRFFRERLVYGCSIFNASMAIFKREAALKVSKDFAEFKLCGDWLFWINMVYQGDVFISNKVLNYYRRTDENLTSKLYASGYNFIEELKMFQIIKAQNKEESLFVNNSIFNRYNSFQRRKDRFNSEETGLILDAFYNFFGGSFSFKFFLLRKRIQQFTKKIRLRIKITFQNGGFFRIRSFDRKTLNE